jgi:hypothetical protein
VGPRAGLDRCGKSRPHRDSIPGPSSPLSIAIPTELTGPLILNSNVQNYDLNKITKIFMFWNIGHNNIFFQNATSHYVGPVRVSFN